MIWIIPLLFGISIAGLASVLARAMYSGAEVYSGTYSAETAREFEDIFLFIPARRIAEAGWAFAAVAFIAVFLLTGSLTSFQGFLVGFLLGVLAGLLALQAPRKLFSFLKARRLRRFNLQLVGTLMNMSNALKAGFSISQAFESVVREGENPIAQEFGLFLHETRIGVSFSEALSRLEKRVASQDLTLVVAAIETARKTGGNLTEIFEKIAATIRERMRIENRIRTLTAQGRLQGIVVGCMPAVIAVALMIIDPGLMMPFLKSKVGLVVILTVAGLITCGAFTIRKIVNIDV